MVQKLCTPHNTNVFVMFFTEKILKTPWILDELIRKFNEGRNFLIETLDKLGYPHKGNVRNFIFIKSKTDAQRIVEKMKSEKKFLSRCCYIYKKILWKETSKIEKC